MANRVSGLAGYNCYVKDPVTGLYTKNNDTPIANLAQYTFTNLLPNTDYSGLLYWTAVDNDGNESAKNPYGPAASIKTLNPTPTQAPMSAADVTAIDAIVARCIAAGAGPGVTIGIVSPKGFLYKSYGSGTTVDDHFRVASQTKTFTGTAVLRAVDAGHLSLDDHLSQYLTGYAADPTIRQLMMMQSGIYDYEGDSTLATNFALNPTTAMTVDQIIAIIKTGTAGRTHASEFAPGTKYFYTNSNYYLLAKIVEAVDPTHRTIDQIIAQDIFTPLGMVNSSFQLATGTPPAPYAIGYDHNPILAIFGIVLNQDVSNQNPAYIWAAGAVISNVSDMVKWGAELRDGSLLSPAMQQLRMTTFSQQPASPTYGLGHTGPPTFGYGLGFLQVGSWFGHDGSWLGYDSCTMFEPHTGTIITVYENFQTAGLLALTTVWYEIASYLYPVSPDQPGYLSGGPSTGTVGCRMQQMTAHAEATVLAPGVFNPYTETNVEYANVPWPDNSTGCYYSGLGAGGSGAGGSENNGVPGGGPGGGGARVERVRILRADGGSTFSCGYGRGTAGGTAPNTGGTAGSTVGNPGNKGGDTFFSSGAVNVVAGGGGPGQPEGGAGAAGVASAAGLTPDPASLINGASGNSAAGANNAGAAGGTGGGGSGTAGSPGGAGKTKPGGAAGTGNGQNSGVSATVGGTPLDESLIDGGPGGGGGGGALIFFGQGVGKKGGKGGKYGGGGGGGGSANVNGGYPAPGESGGDGGNKIEWF